MQCEMFLLQVLDIEEQSIFLIQKEHKQYRNRNKEELPIANIFHRIMISTLCFLLNKSSQYFILLALHNRFAVDSSSPNIYFTYLYGYICCDHLRPVGKYSSMPKFMQILTMNTFLSEECQIVCSLQLHINSCFNSVW